MISRKQFWWTCLLLFGFFNVLGLVEVVQFVIWRNFQGVYTPWYTHVLVGFCDWYFFALMMPVILWAALRYPLSGSWRASHAGLHVLGSITAAMFLLLVDVPFLMNIPHAVSRPWTAREMFIALFINKFILYMLMYWIVVGVGNGLLFAKAYQARERKAALLETQLTQARLQMLRMQLQPHFLFNTLNAISALLHKDVDRAEWMLVHLGDLLRTTLAEGGATEAPLAQELENLNTYLAIEQTRLGPRLAVQFDIDPATLGACLPTFLLQPLVENAIRHGLAPMLRQGRLEIRAMREGSFLRLEVSDNGPGLPAGGWTEGVGLSNTRTRLAELYGVVHTLDLVQSPEGGLTVRMRLPFREQTQDNASAKAEEAA
jgi:sensor histidine kinase YesM